MKITLKTKQKYKSQIVPFVAIAAWGPIYCVMECELFDDGKSLKPVVIYFPTMH